MTVPEGTLVELVKGRPGLTWKELLEALQNRGWPTLTRRELNRQLYAIPELYWWDPGIGEKRRWYCGSITSNQENGVSEPPGLEDEVWVRPVPSSGLELYPWQREALAAWEERGEVGVVEAVTGSGKTRLALAAAEFQLRRGGYVVIVVPTIDLLRQWEKEARKLLIGKLGMNVSIGILSDKRKDTLDEHEVLITTASSGCQYVLLPYGSTGLLIADEVHRYGSENWSRVLEPEFDRRLGLTATYERDHVGYERYLDPYFEDIVFSVDYRRALEDGVIAPFKIAFVGSRFSAAELGEYEEHDEKARRYRRRLVNQHGLPEEPFGDFIREVNRLRSTETAEGALWAGLYLNAFAKRREVLARARAKYDRLSEIAGAVRRAEKTIIFAQTKAAAGEAVERFSEHEINGSLLTSDMDRMSRKSVLAGFESGESELVAAPKLLDEGIDVAAADLAIILATGRSRRQTIQRMGRVLRKKEDGRLARLAVFYVEDTTEDPQTAHGDFLELVSGVAHDIRDFSTSASAEEICDYLNECRS